MVIEANVNGVFARTSKPTVAVIETPNELVNKIVYFVKTLVCVGVPDIAQVALLTVSPVGNASDEESKTQLATVAEVPALSDVGAMDIASVSTPVVPVEPT